MILSTLSARSLVVTYFLCVLGFASIYYFVPDGYLNQKLSFINALYFSVVTITTLGYGDILPKSEFIQIVISIQALLGLIILGLLINAAWSSYAEKIEIRTAKQLKEQAQNENDRKLYTYVRALDWVFSNLSYSYFEVTTPIKKRDENSIYFNPDYKEKDLIGMFDVSLRYSNGFNTAIDAFYNNEDKLINELKYILSNFDLDHHQRLQQKITDYISCYFSDLARESLQVKYSSDCPAGENIIAIRKLLINHEDGDQYKKEFSATVLNPILIFSINLKQRYNLFKSMNEEFGKIEHF